MSVQFIKDESGNTQFVVIPVSEYERLVNGNNGQYESIPYQAAEDDDETIPNEVVQIMFDKDISLQAAWREYRGLSQYAVAAALGVKQATISQIEKQDSKPQKKTREKLAKLYGCKPEQLIL